MLSYLNTYETFGLVMLNLQMQSSILEYFRIGRRHRIILRDSDNSDIFDTDSDDDDFRASDQNRDNDDNDTDSLTGLLSFRSLFFVSKCHPFDSFCN